MNAATIFARCCCVYQKVRYRITPGKKPDSTRPSRKRRDRIARPWLTSIVQPETMPQTIMMGPSQYFAPIFLERHIAGHFEEEVADEKDACASSVNGIADSEILLHLQLRESNVHPINISEDVAEKQERNDTPGNLAIGALVQIRRMLAAAEAAHSHLAFAHKIDRMDRSRVP